MIDRLNPGRRYSDAVTHNGLVYAVEVPVSETADIRDQTREVLAELDATLALAGSSRDRMLSATVYLTDMADYEGMNAVWEDWLPNGAAPSRACVQVAALAHSGWRIEISVIAATL